MMDPTPATVPENPYQAAIKLTKSLTSYQGQGLPREQYLKYVDDVIALASGLKTDLGRYLGQDPASAGCLDVALKLLKAARARAGPLTKKAAPRCDHFRAGFRYAMSLVVIDAKLAYGGWPADGDAALGGDIAAAAARAMHAVCVAATDGLCRMLAAAPARPPPPMPQHVWRAEGPPLGSYELRAALNRAAIAAGTTYTLIYRMQGAAQCEAACAAQCAGLRALRCTPQCAARRAELVSSQRAALQAQERWLIEDQRQTFGRCGLEDSLALHRVARRAPERSRQSPQGPEGPVRQEKGAPGAAPEPPSAAHLYQWALMQTIREYNEAAIAIQELVLTAESSDLHVEAVAIVYVNARDSLARYIASL